MLTSSQLPAVAPRFDGVDLLRGLSILAVIDLHVSIAFRFAGLSLGSGLPAPLRRLLFSNGGRGVTVFFAISGFLITLTSIRRFGTLRAMRPGVFYRIRFARIAPLLLALLLVLSLLHFLNISGFHVKNVSLARALFAALTFHLNWLEGRYNYLPPNWDILWSLSVEEMFYLFFPLACLFLLRLRHGMAFFFAVLTGLLVLGPFARTVWAYTEIWGSKSYLSGMDAIAMGCLTALLVTHLQSRKYGCRRAQRLLLTILEAIGAALMLLLAIWPRWHWLRPALHLLGRSGLDDTLLPFGVCLIMLGTVLRGARGRPWTAPLRWFGRQSYEVYMLHEFIVIGITGAAAAVHHGNHLLWWLLVIALSAPLAWITAHFFTEPANRYLRGAARPHSVP